MTWKYRWLRYRLTDTTVLPSDGDRYFGINWYADGYYGEGPDHPAEIGIAWGRKESVFRIGRLR
jgi:hypothetical protein